LARQQDHDQAEGDAVAALLLAEEERGLIADH
jgi:IS5 family transposase